VDAGDLKSPGRKRPCRFEPCPGHQLPLTGLDFFAPAGIDVATGRASPGRNPDGAPDRNRAREARRGRIPMKVRAYAIVALALLGSSGCLVGPDDLRPESPTPPSWGEIDSKAAPEPARAIPQPIAATWWTTFDDAQLGSLVGRAMRANLDGRQAGGR